MEVVIVEASNPIVCLILSEFLDLQWCPKWYSAIHRSEIFKSLCNEMLFKPFYYNIL